MFVITEQGVIDWCRDGCSMFTAEVEAINRALTYKSFYKEKFCNIF